ncbi:MAG: DNA-3-methyladenine glycosylase 2 family protein [Thermodesulfobacteriota bacterium]
MKIFEYGQGEVEYLSRRDKKLGAAIERIGLIEREVTPDLFTALVQSVVAQQISSKSARTVCARLHDLLDEVTPASIAATETVMIQQCGMSMRKATYIKGLAEAALSGAFDPDAMHTLSDTEVIERLSSLNGIGVWTAEMLLIFSLCRPDVLSWGDLGIRRGIMNLYGLKELGKEQFERYRKRYSPYGSTASLYLWALSTT